MPRKRKSGLSPARQPGGPAEGGSLGYNSSTGHRLPQGNSHSMASNFQPISNDKETIVKSMQEMFSHLDPEVIYIVMSECDFKVENAMDSLLELSVAAEGAVPPPASGFEHTAATLLNPANHLKPYPAPDTNLSQVTQQPHSSSPTDLSPEVLDTLIDQELEALNAVQERHHNTTLLPSSSPSQHVSQAPLPELLPGNRNSGSKDHIPAQLSSIGGTGEHLSTISPDQRLDKQKNELDFTHLLTETSSKESRASLDLAMSKHPSAFQVYKKQEVHPERPKFSSPVFRRPIPAMNTLNPHPSSSPYVSLPWNLEAPVFFPRIHGNQGPCFITPVAYSPPAWTSPTRLVFPQQGQAPPKPCAAIPKSWTLPAPSQMPTLASKLHFQGKVLVLLRGPPGSGKSTLARALLEHNPVGVILSTDDYFICDGEYRFDPASLGEAHEWNQKRAKEAFTSGKNPIIIDNTNMQGWEMKPYVAQALKHGYKVLFKEPDTWWKNKPRELERRTTHNVAVETIRRMLNGYERFVTIQSIMGSHMPEHKLVILQENTDTQSHQPDTSCPDLVDQPALSERCPKQESQLFVSLPDVSTVPENTTHQEINTVKSVHSPDLSDLCISDSSDEIVDLGELDSTLDSLLESSTLIADQRIPDCIVESVMNDDMYLDETHPPSTESIGQRVKRERTSKTAGFDPRDHTDLIKGNEQFDRDNTKDLNTILTNTAAEEVPERTNFVGDWPCEASMKQRQVRRRQPAVQTHTEEVKEIDETASVLPNTDITEFQKLIDFIQTGVLPAQADSRSDPEQECFGEKFERKDEEKDSFEKVLSTSSKSDTTRSTTTQAHDQTPELSDYLFNGSLLDHPVVEESSTDDSEGVKVEEEVDDIIDRSCKVSEAAGEKLSEEMKDIANKVESIDVEDDSPVVRTVLKNSTEVGIETDNSVVDETCQRPTSVCDELAETESLGGTQEKKQRRRSGKLCKLALSFPPNYSPSSLDEPEGSAAETADNDTPSPNQETLSSLNSNINSECNVVYTQANGDDELQPHASPADVEPGSYTQTEPEDFALLWRCNHRDNYSDMLTDTSHRSRNIRMLCGDSSRFVPKLSSAVSAAVALHPSGQTEVPDRVVHEKGTQVEERELWVTQDRLKHLRILSCHFKLVSFDTLEDLYDKCYQDLEWTTNLLLDSGEKFFRVEDTELEGDGKTEKEEEIPSPTNDVDQSGKCTGVLCGQEAKGWSEVRETENQAQRSASGMAEGPNESKTNTKMVFSGDASVSLLPDVQLDVASCLEFHPQTEDYLPGTTQTPEQSDSAELKDRCGIITAEGAVGRSSYYMMDESFGNFEDDAASMDKINQLLLTELEEIEREEKQKKEERRSHHIDIRTVELKLSTELALQLTELFGPVGVDPGTCLDDDFTLQMDLNLAKLLHQKWKDTIQEKQRQANLSIRLLQDSSTSWGHLPVTKQARARHEHGLLSRSGHTSAVEPFGQGLVMDHWNMSNPPVSLRHIMEEEQALQNAQKSRKSCVDIDRQDGAAMLKEKQLYSMFPTIDRLFLLDIFKDHNYNLSQTELFLHSLLNEEPVKTVIAPEVPHSDHHRAASKEREKKPKPPEPLVVDYQDTQNPEYEDFRAEASLQRRRQLECFAKAAEAFKQGRREVASFYAQQGHLHGQRMHEANHRAAVQIFERVNSSLLPRNILDLHGLHVNEALDHLDRVLEDKTAACEQGLCLPQLSVITGRGNHSQGGVARIRPAVLDYLTNKRYRFTEPKPGLVLVSLK